MYDLSTLQNTPWLMEQGRLQSMAASLAKIKDWPTAGKIAKRAKKVAAGAMRKVSGKIAVMQIQGIIEQRMSMYGYLFGGFSTEFGEQALSQLLASKEVQAIVLDIDSPGGTSYGVEEFSDMIYDARAKKPIYALSNAMMASAAYWIGCAATQVASTPSGDVGSIGVYSLHVEFSEALKEEGIKVTIAKSGKYKAEFNQFEKLSQESQEYMQEQVDACYTKFTKAVAKGRGVSASEVRGPRFGEGRVLSADEALANGLIDKVMTFSQLLEKLGANGQAIQGPQMSKTDMLRRRLQHQREQEKTAGLIPPKEEPKQEKEGAAAQEK
jgi:signal peptide peptidase SppA